MIETYYLLRVMQWHQTPHYMNKCSNVSGMLQYTQLEVFQGQMKGRVRSSTEFYLNMNSFLLISVFSIDTFGEFDGLP